MWSPMTLAAPFPYFGGKRRAAHIVWDALGDPSGYVEPFAGSAAVLLARADFSGRRVETLNDADGWLVNTWRAIRLFPDALAHHLGAWPVTEIDYHARLAWLNERRTDGLVSWLEGDPDNCDAKAAAHWLYVVACGIGDPFGSGPWRVIDGRLSDTHALPHLGDAGQGVNRKLPHLGDAGQGVNRELPHLGNAGRGVDRLAAYLHRLADRLSRTRITCGDWKRVVQPSVYRAGAGGDGSRAIFLDPPYATSGDLYAHGDDQVAHEVRDWCLTAPKALRVVLAGYDTEHDALLDHGWRKVEGRAGGGAGYSSDPTNGRRERLWLSPACLDSGEQMTLGDLA
jgi:site-specific DNA-adenine methylase